MANIIVVFSKIEEAKGIRNLLVKNGYSVPNVCITGAHALEAADELGHGVVVSGYHLTDMMYSELKEDLPDSFDMLLLASTASLQQCDLRDVVSLSVPLKIQDLLNTVDMMCEQADRKHKRRKAQPRERKEEETLLINEAKKLLMERNGMTETEAHKYIQKCSMDSATNMVETAHMVLTMYRE
ncbi:MAG: ANTAR domain-containing protein [Lachnospiraceae bacterium]|nr:ANTAR domain-containing protein [Lachnospiraceae bacterium]